MRSVNWRVATRQTSPAPSFIPGAPALPRLRPKFANQRCCCYTRSKIAAIPWPPPMHIVARP